MILRGAAGTAVLVDMTGRPSRAHSAVGTYFLHCPGQSPMFINFTLSMIHLRPEPGLPSAKLAFPQATHEMMLVALDPTFSPVPDDPESWLLLTPLNYTQQVALPSDEAACELLGICALEVVNGGLWAEPPLSGMVHPWKGFITRVAQQINDGVEHDHVWGPWQFSEVGDHEVSFCACGAMNEQWIEK